MSDCCTPNLANSTTESRSDNSQAVNFRFKISGMDCAEEVAILKQELSPLVGGADQLSFDILNGGMTISSTNSSFSISLILEAVKKTGMSAELWVNSPTQKNQNFWQRRGRALLTLTSGLSAALGFLTHALLSGSVTAALGIELGSSHSVPVAVKGVFAVAVIAGSWFVLPKAWFAARRLRPDINLLMVIAVIGAIFIGDWLEAATVAFLFSLSLTLESWSIGRARRAVAMLMSLSPTLARVVGKDGSESSVSPSLVTVGSRFIVKPGERLPLDGRVLEGVSEINQAPITGESIPQLKQAGDAVYAGTINGDGALIVESTKAANDTTIARIIRMVGEAQSLRAPSEQWVEHFARIYTPVIMLVALVVLLGPPLLLAGDWNEWIYNALVLLVIACPCALVISTPVSIVAALAAAARNGVLIKGGLYVEAPARLRALALDKTGTLTSGKPQVIEVVPMNGHDRKELLEIAASLEAGSTHPLAVAICEIAKKEGIPASPVSGFQIMQGKGARGVINGVEFWLGSHRYLEERKEETPEIHNRLETLAASGQTVVVIGDGNHVCGFIALADALRPEARQAIIDLRKSGVSEIIMLTGDNEGTAQVIARDAGVDTYQAELLPTDKVKAVENLVSRYGYVAMVGDGVNDAPAMACASLGIAMGAMGSDAAIETADIALMSDDLSKLAWLIQHSRRTVGIIRQNITFALVVKALFILLTVSGFATLWAAIAADMGASLLVIANGLRLLKSV
jgi:Cd2+/Zn2+-exporting ATPase